MKSRLIMLAVTLVAFILGMTGSVGAAPAGDDNSVLILGPTVNGGTGSLEAVTAIAQGFTVDVVDGPTWRAMSAADFASYRAIILGDDPNAGIGTGPLVDAEFNRAVWSPEIDGNIIIIGTNPTFHSSFGPGGMEGGDEVTDFGIAFAAALTGRTGAYISLSVYYANAAPSTDVDVLDKFGAFKVTVVGQFSIPGGLNDIHIVSTAATAPLTDTLLSNWGNSVHEAFDNFPPLFEPFAILTTFSGTGELFFPDGTSGIPYILTAGGSFTAVVEPDPTNPNAPVEVFSGEVGDPEGNPFIGFRYPKVTAGGIVTALCCKFKDPRETDGFGTGRFLHYDPGNLDMRAALRESTLGAEPFDPNCEALLPLIPDGAIIARPWQRINPDPEPDNVMDLRNYGDLAFAQSLEGAFCIVTSTVGVVGPAVTEADPFPLVGYSSECDTDEPAFRPVTGTISIEPRNVETPTADVENADFIQTSTMECDGARNGRRSPISGYWINMRNDLTGNSPFALVNRHYSDLFDEIVALQDGGTTEACVNAGGDRIGPLLAKTQRVKNSLNKNKKKPAKILSETVPLSQELSRLALAIPDCEDNPNGGIGGRTLAGTPLACSHLGHPATFDADKDPVFPPDDDCLIPNDILSTLGLPERLPPP